MTIAKRPTHWLEALLETQARTGADAVTGRMVRRVPDGSPRWITEEPFLELGVEQFADGTEMPSAATFNTMMSSGWLKAEPGNSFRACLWRRRRRGHGVLPGREGRGPVDPLFRAGLRL